MKGFLYILVSQKDDKTYTGSTNNLKKRLIEHNAGLVLSTKNRRPLRLIYREELSSLKEARVREHYFKSCAGRQKMKKIFENEF